MLRDKKDQRIASLEVTERRQKNKIKSLKRIQKQLEAKIQHLEGIINNQFEIRQSKIN